MPVSVSVVGEPRLVVASVASALDRWARERGQTWAVAADSPTAASDPPDVVVIVALGRGIPDELPKVQQETPDAAVVWLAGDPGGNELADAAAQGCNSIVSACNDVCDVAAGVEHAAEHVPWASPDLVPKLVQHLRCPPPSVVGPLSPRELEVLSLLRVGRSTTQISGELFISLHTTKNHIRRILNKLEAHSRLEAVAAADRLHLL